MGVKRHVVVHVLGVVSADLIPKGTDVKEVKNKPHGCS